MGQLAKKRCTLGEVLCRLWKPLYNHQANPYPIGNCGWFGPIIFYLWCPLSPCQMATRCERTDQGMKVGFST